LGKLGDRRIYPVEIFEKPSKHFYLDILFLDKGISQLREFDVFHTIDDLSVLAQRGSDFTYNEYYFGDAIPGNKVSTYRVPYPVKLQSWYNGDYSGRYMLNKNLSLTYEMIDDIKRISREN
jgi:hypothetical protein